MNITNEFTEWEVSLLLDMIHDYYESDPSVGPLLDKLWKLDRQLQIQEMHTDKAWRQAYEA